MSDETTPSAPGGWYTDPGGSGRQRYWDGTKWTDAYREHPAYGALGPTPASNGTEQTVYVERRGNGFAVTALVCGIVGAVFGLIPFTFIIAVVLGLLALVFGILGRRRAKREPAAGRKGMALAGAILGAIALTLGVIGAVIVDEAVTELDEGLSCIEEADTLAEINRC